MKLKYIALFLFVIFHLCIRAQQTSQIDYVLEIKNWDSQRSTNLKSENGWLNIVGLFWLKEGENTFGCDSNNNIIFPIGKAESRMGNFTLKNSQVFLTINPNIEVEYNSKPFVSGVIYSDTAKSVKVLSFKSLIWFIIKRGDKYGVRLRDLTSNAITHFSHINRFDTDEQWKITAEFIPYQQNQLAGINDVIGQTTQTELAGALHFNINGKAYSLDATREGDDLFIVFADETSGVSTYGSGRFLYVKYPTDGNKVILDFNKAYNPPCAFTNFATCPLPLPQNVLHISITAGEKNYGHH